MPDRDLRGRMLGEFVVCELIDEGGYAAVYRGEQPRFRRDVVIKVLHEQWQRNDLMLQRFIREAQIASSLRHPYVAHIFSFGVERTDGTAWIAMEMVRGISLKRWLLRYGRCRSKCSCRSSSASLRWSRRRTIAGSSIAT